MELDLAVSQLALTWCQHAVQEVLWQSQCLDAMAPIHSGQDERGLGMEEGWPQSRPLCVTDAPLAFTSMTVCTVMTDLKATKTPARCLTTETVLEVHLISKTLCTAASRQRQPFGRSENWSRQSLQTQVRNKAFTPKDLKKFIIVIMFSETGRSQGRRCSSVVDGLLSVH